MQPLLQRSPGPIDPDAAEVEIQQIDGRLRDLLEFSLQVARQEQVCLQPVHALQPFQQPRLPLFRPLPFGDIAGDALDGDGLAQFIGHSADGQLAPDGRAVSAEQFQFQGSGLDRWTV